MTVRAAETTTSAWIRRFHPAPAAAARLVCFPHAGGAASFYFPVSRALSPDVEVLALQYPGRQDRRTEPCVEDLGILADLITGELGTWCDKPLALFGHSMGATLAFEVARRLERDGVRPCALFASGRRAPSIHRDDRVHLSSDAELLAGMVRLGGTSAQLLEDPELVGAVLPATRADYKALETYRYVPGPALHCPLTVLTGDADDQVNLDEAAAWAEHSEGEFDLEVFPGGHFYLAAQAAAVIAVVRGRLATEVPGLAR
ncbi:thioesterase II family protein [Streptomyces viridiviolaceus]